MKNKTEKSKRCKTQKQLLTSSQPVPSHSLSNGSPGRLLPPSLLLLSMTSCGVGHPSGGQLSRLCPLPSPGAPQPARWQGRVRSRNGLEAAQALPSSDHPISV